nr:MAG TPA: hypothetical protein [Caudoviricetes sp.]
MNIREAHKSLGNEGAADAERHESPVFPPTSIRGCRVT